MKSGNETNKNKQTEMDKSDSAPEISIEDLAKKELKKADIAEKVVTKVFRHLMHRVLSKLKQTGEAEFLGLGKLRMDDKGSDTDFVLEPYSDEKIEWNKKLLLQQLFGGDRGNIKDPGPESSTPAIKFYFPVDNFIELMADERGVPAEELDKLFKEQLEKAYTAMIETGEGILPDFGILRYENRKTAEFSFEPNEELARIFEENSE